MDASFWVDRWQRADIGFHQKSVHDVLSRHWRDLALPRGSKVFVPLCGKSLDMVWLAEAGHEVIGVELSELAVDGFFAELSRRPGIEQCDGYAISRAGPYEIWRGDYFAFPPDVMRLIAAVYDRAALVAMPHSMQSRYADKLAALTPFGAKVFLIALEYEQSVMEGPPFPLPPDRVRELFDKNFDIRVIVARDVIASHPHFRAKGATWLTETLYVLTPRRTPPA